MKKTELIFNIVLMAGDFLMVAAAGAGAYMLRRSPWLKDWRAAGEFFDRLPFGDYLPALLVIALVWVAIFGLAGLYQTKIDRKYFGDIPKVVVACCAGVMAITMVVFFRKELFDSRFIVLMGWFFAVVLVSLERAGLKFIWSRNNFAGQKTILMGNQEIAKKLSQELAANREVEIIPIGDSLDFDLNLVKTRFSTGKFDEIILCVPERNREYIAALANFCEERLIDFRFIPDLFQTFFTNIDAQTVAEFPVLEFKRTPLEGWGGFMKRMMDIAVSGVGIVLLFPVGIIIGLAIKYDSPGQVIVKLKRVSQGKEFYLYKFRSMKNNSHELKKQLLDRNQRNDGPLFKIKNDPRVTRIGGFLRRTWLDEFPQLINVFRGEMSLVGPRPHEPEEIAKYQNHHKRTFFVKAGMTGLAQINGGCNLNFEEEVKLDLYYIKNWSIGRDIGILSKTIILFFNNKPEHRESF
jgi:exopolysaccharide biosynthesis polyprenyl glycosylphosphotransferase